MDRNCYEIPARLPERFRTWVRDHCPAEAVRELVEPHVTLLYGFDPRLYLEVEADVQAAGDITDDWEFEEPRPGDKARDAWLLRFRSPKLQALFAKLDAEYTHSTYLHEGQFCPHITLCYMKEDIW